MTMGLDNDLDLDKDQVSLPRQAADVVTLLRQRRDGSLHGNDLYILPLKSHEFGS